MRRAASRGALVAAAIAFAARVASASPSYPDALDADLGLPAAPGCQLCHHAAAAPVGPVDTPFGEAMVARGLMGGDDVASLSAALVRMRSDHVDSDGDGAEDLDELSWGGDPNHADVPEGGPLTPVTYGCALSGAPTAWPAGAVLAALALVAAGRRRAASGNARR